LRPFPRSTRALGSSEPYELPTASCYREPGRFGPMDPARTAGKQPQRCFESSVKRSCRYRTLGRAVRTVRADDILHRHACLFTREPVPRPRLGRVAGRTR
jgi:hypothetical protein